MTKAFLAVALLCLAGCHHHNSKSVEFVITPNTGSSSVTLTCKDSSSNKCYFAFAGRRPSENMLVVGATMTVQGIEPGDMYCAEPHQVAVRACQQASVPPRRSTVRKNSTVDSTSGD